jgi:endo-1,4-beta-xylanase
LPIHFTETTILSGTREARNNAWGPTTPEAEAAQAEQAANFYTMLFAHPAVHAVTWWDFSDYHAWQRAPAGLLREDMTPKPVYERLIDLVHKKWWTRTEARTDDTGSASFPAFYGRYRVSAELASNQTATEEFQVQRGQPNQITLRR